jgi:hypothetical protein
MSSLRQPVTPRLPSLPFSELGWDRFEQVMHDLCTNLTLMRAETVRRYGTQGQAQGGLDVIGTDTQGRRWGFSCKRYKGKYQPSLAKTHIAETTEKCDQYVILISGPTSPDVLKEVAKNPNWEIWGGDDLSLRVRNDLTPETARRLVDHHFGPLWRRDFLGVPSVGVFLPPGDHFRAFLDTKRWFHHAFPLVGRQLALQELKDFSDSPARVLILPGRGGIGKTRLLREFADAYDATHPDHAIRFLNEGVPLTTYALDELPPVPCLVIVDDAHRIELSILLAWLRQRPESRLVLSTRPQGVDYLSSQLSRAGIDTTDIRRLTVLGRLTRGEVRELAMHILRPDQVKIVEQLVRVTRDCPLVTVVGGRLLAERAVPPELLERDDDFRQTVLNRFRDEMLGAVDSRVPQPLCQRLLPLLAALNPLPASDETLASHLNIPLSQFRTTLSALESAGLLMRRGDALRLTPDVLADHLLHQACFTDQGTPTGFADELFEAFADRHLARLLRNLAELDWRVRVSREDTPSPLLAQVWEKIHRSFLAEGHAGRERLLELLGESAYFLPERILGIVQYAVQNPAQDTTPTQSEGDVWSIRTITHEQVLRRVPPILRRCSYAPACIDSCFDLLWELGRNDSQPTNSNTDHPIRILTELAEYGCDKPLWVNQAALKAARRWLNRPEAFTGFHLPFVALDPLLVKSSLEHWSDGIRVFMRPILWSHTRLCDIRKGVVETLASLLEHENTAVVVRAIRSLGDALAGPMPYLNIVITDDVFAGWEQEQLEILVILQAALERNPPAVVSLAILDQVRYHARHGTRSAVRHAAAALIAAIDHPFEVRCTRTLLPRLCEWDHHLGEEAGEEEPTSPLDRLQARAAQLASGVAEELWERYPQPCDLVGALSDRVRNLEAVGENPNPSFLLGHLVTCAPGNAAELAKAVVAAGDSPLAGLLCIILYPIHGSDAPTAFALCADALDSHTQSLRRSVGHFCQYGLRGNEPCSPSEIALFKRLLDDSDPLIRRAGIACLRRVAQSDPRQAMTWATELELGDDSDALGELCRLALARRDGVPNAFTDADIQSIVTKLLPVQNLDHHHIEFLGYASERIPQAVLKMLVDRCSIKNGYAIANPIPFHGLDNAFRDLRDDPRLAEFLRDIRSRVAQAEVVARWHLCKLYEELSHHFAETGIAVVDEWVRSGTEHELLVAVELLGHAPPEVIFTQQALIAGALEQAASFSSKCHRQVHAQFVNLAVGGTRSGVAGEPYPQDIDLRDRCEELLQTLPTSGYEYQLFADIRQQAQSAINRELSRLENEDEE